MSLGGLVRFLPSCLPCEPSATALCAIVTAMHCVYRYEMLTQGSVTAYTCNQGNQSKATKELEMQGDLQEEPGLVPGAAAAPKQACNETKATNEPEMQGDLQEEPGLVSGAAAAPKQARVRGHGGKPFSAAEEDELRRGNPNPNPNPNPSPNPNPNQSPTPNPNRNPNPSPNPKPSPKPKPNLNPKPNPKACASTATARGLLFFARAASRRIARTST